MTSATTAAFGRGRMRIAAAAAGPTAALVLTACGAGDGDPTDKEPPSPAPTATESAGTGGGSGEPSGGQREIEGNWLAAKQGRAVALIVTGEQAAVFETDGAVCSGTAKEEAGMQMIRLTCPGGSGGRTEGMVDSVDSTSLTVTWEGGVGRETYQKAEGGKLPSGLPTAGMGS